MSNLFFRKVNARASTTRSTWIFLHGLLGSSKNFMSLARNDKVSYHNDIYLPDIRNHGQSPHTETHELEDLTADLIEFMDSQNLDKVRLLGHSMGGRVSMDALTRHPDRFERAVIVDTGPFDYYDMEKYPNSRKTQGYIYKLDKVGMRGRTFAEIKADVLEIAEGNTGLAGFMMTNLEKLKDKDSAGKKIANWRWRVNYKGLMRGYTDYLGWTYGGGARQ